MREAIPIKVKRECCRLRDAGMTARDIYNDYFVKMVEQPQSLDSFKRSLNRWRGTTFPDDTTLTCGTYEGFTAHNATVQVSKTGEIVQAWIKQKADEFDPEDFLAAIRDVVEPYEHKPAPHVSSNRMLEIPLFDMHWGIADFNYYEPVLRDILDLIQSKHWDRIVIPIGQDLFHNDSIVNPTTTKGTMVDKVDMTKAVKDARIFMTAIIDSAIGYANEVRVMYTPGNHDRSICWMFMQVLLERYGTEIVDDSMQYRKIFTYGKNSIMVTHGDSKQATVKGLAHIFPISYPEEFAQANVREVHAGHLHHEGEGDIYGIMIRRLSTRAKVDDWSDRQDFIGAHRRFMVFEWDSESLRSIHYI